MFDFRMRYESGKPVTIQIATELDKINSEEHKTSQFDAVRWPEMRIFEDHEKQNLTGGS